MLNSIRVIRSRAMIAWLALISVLILLPRIGAAQSDGLPRAHATRTLSATDHARLHLVKSKGSAIVEEGHAYGGLPGTVKASLRLGATVVANFTIYLKGGSISGRGSGELKGRPGEPSYGGTMTVSHGTGRYAHVRGHGGFYGTLNRSTLAMLIQTTGTLSY
jgi:hypothetical protein